jgi:hypothetical protein
MSIESKHPSFTKYRPRWVQMRDTYEPHTVIEKGSKYLPYTAGQKADGVSAGGDGLKDYEDYKRRAVFHDLLKESVQDMLGTLHSNPATIELPDSMEGLRESATIEGHSLELVLREINAAQLMPGRLGIHADMPQGPQRGAPKFYLALKDAENVVNWYLTDEGVLEFVVIDESEYVLAADGLDWELQERFRELRLIDGVYQVRLHTDGAAGEWTIPMVGGRGPTDSIPFTFLNSVDMNPEPEDPCLIGISDSALAAYRGEADYRQHLHMHAQDTLVISGTMRDADPNAPIRVGTGSAIEMQEGDAKFIGVNEAGLTAQAESIQSDIDRVEKLMGKMSEDRRSAESGEALTTRRAAKTVTLYGVAKAGAAALQASLRQIAIWTGADPLEVVVTPNTEFTERRVSVQEIVDLLDQGLISLESAYQMAKDNQLTAGLEFDAEMERINQEQRDRTRPNPLTPLPAVGDGELSAAVPHQA